MVISAKKILFNLKIVLLVSFSLISVIAIYLLHAQSFIDHYANIKEQYILIDKIVHTDLTDQQVGTILVNDSVSKLALLSKRLHQPYAYDFFSSNDESKKLLLSKLDQSSQLFRENSQYWSESLKISRESTHERMIESRNQYLKNLEILAKNEIETLLGIIETIMNIVFGLVIFNLSSWILYRYRLTQISEDIENTCSTEFKTKIIHTKEFDYISKNLQRKVSAVTTNSTMIHQQTDLYNEKGMLSLFNAKKVSRSANNIFLTVFEIDQQNLFQRLSIENRYAIIKKIGDIIKMYEQSLDIIGYIEHHDRLVYISSRANRQIALDEAEKIRETVEEASFNTDKGPLKFTLSGGLLVKVPAKTIEDIIVDAAELIKRAQANGGNQIGRIR